MNNIPNFPTIEEIQRKAKAKRIQAIYNQLSHDRIAQDKFAQETNLKPMLMI